VEFRLVGITCNHGLHHGVDNIGHLFYFLILN
jgi:hypothetical protein